MTEHMKKIPERDLSLQSGADQDDEHVRLVKRVNAMADELLKSIDPDAPTSDSYRNLLRKAMMIAAEAQRNLQSRERDVARLQKLTVTDGLTRILNRRGFERAFERAVHMIDRRGGQSLLLLFDLNDFKLINDRYGHTAGDLVLTSVATLLRSHTRRIDDVARIGGDEFAVILSDTDAVMGYRKALDIDIALNELMVPWEDFGIRIRASMGIARIEKGRSPVDILREADSAMYAQKRDATAVTDARALEHHAAPQRRSIAG